jgi:hypothetical protein
MDMLRMQAACQKEARNQRKASGNKVGKSKEENQEEKEIMPLFCKF